MTGGLCPFPFGRVSEAVEIKEMIWRRSQLVWLLCSYSLTSWLLLMVDGRDRWLRAGIGRPVEAPGARCVHNDVAAAITIKTSIHQLRSVCTANQPSEISVRSVRWYVARGGGSWRRGVMMVVSLPDYNPIRQPICQRCCLKSPSGLM